MRSWQKPTRLLLAVFAVAFAGLVYRSIGDRPTAVTSVRPDRLDPKAVTETTGGFLQQVRGEEREYEVKSARTLSYEDGSAKYFDVEITTVRRDDGRSFVVTAQEGSSGPDQVELQLDGDVVLADSTGFMFEADSASFNQDDGVARVPGRVDFKKGRLQGSGIGAAYDQRNDVLRVDERSAVRFVDTDGRVTMDGSAGATTFDRSADQLVFQSSVRIIREGETIEAEHVTAHLSEDEDVLRSLELRGESRVSGGTGPIEAMSAEAIDMTYREDGEALERVAAVGSAEVAIAPEGEVSGRTIAGESLDVEVSAEGSVGAVSGRGGVRLELPAAGRTPPRTIRAQSLDARGEPGRGLTSAVFAGEVVFTEGTDPQSGREARSRELTASLQADGIADAVFRGGVSFEDGPLIAEASEIRYSPATDALRLTTPPADGPSSVTDEHIRIAARAIDLSIERRQFNATGDVQTTVTARPAREAGGEEAAERLPGLLREQDPARINADQLEYDSRSGRAVYAGRATLSQAETAIRGDTITLDRRTGNLTVAGAARSTLLFGPDRFDGQADDIVYDDMARRVTYSTRLASPLPGRSVQPVPQGATQTGSRGVPPTGARGPTAAAGATARGRTVLPLPPPRPARLIGPQGDLSATQIDLILAPRSNELERLEARTGVTMRVGARTASGAALTFHTEDERYLLTGDGLTPVTIRDACRETTGRSLTFFKSSDRIVVDGNDTRRTETRPCTPQPLR